MDDTILFERHGPQGRLAVVTLNRPQALNAQNLAMVQAFAAQLQAWEADPAVTRLLILGAGGKAFCAGGDIKALWQPGCTPEARQAFFTHEYALCAALKATRLVTVAYLDGITMGGGVGLSIHADHRIATPQTRWAMPESAIGFYPDIAASHFLNNLPAGRAFGRYLGLTGAQLRGSDCLGVVANHYMDSGQDAALAEALADADELEPALAAFALPVEGESAAAFLAQSLAPYADLPLPLFLELLDDRGLLPDDLCALSLAVIDEALRRGARQSYADTLAMDEVIVRHFLAGNTFREGVRAKLIDKDNQPDWAGVRLSAIDPQAVLGYFK